MNKYKVVPTINTNRRVGNSLPTVCFRAVSTVGNELPTLRRPA